METIILILLIAAFVLFLLGIRSWFGPEGAAPRFNLIAAGLACWVLTQILAQIP